MTVTQAQSRDALRRAVGLLQDMMDDMEGGSPQWWTARDAFLADLAALLGVGTEGIVEALTPTEGENDG